MRLTWPLVGRSEEIHTIQAAVTAPDLCGIVVCGPAGVGKSRIIREALHGKDARWIVGTTSARELPLGAFAAWAGDPGGDRLQLVRGVIAAVTATPRGTPALLGVDDAQLLDDLSAFVLHQIVQRRAARVVLTVRDGDTIPDAVREVWKDHPFDRLDLQPLGGEDSADLLAATLGAPVDTDAAKRLWKLTRGNALYLRNIVEQELADGRLEQHNGCWHWIGRPVLPTSLVELIESRFGDLPSEVGDVVDVLAVGEPLELTALQRITSAESVEEANVRGLITLHDTDSGVDVRVAHPLYGEMRRTRAPSARLRRLRGLVATELATGIDHDDLRVRVRRATLSLDSDLAPDAALLVTAARGAIWLADLPLAERLAAAAVQAGAGPDANFLRAHALSWMFRGEDADAALAEVATDALTDAEQARCAYLRATNLLWALCQPDRAKAHIDEVSHTLNPQCHSWIDAFLTVYWFAMDQPEASSAAAKHLVLEDLPGVAGPETAWVLTTIAADAGRTDDAVTVAGIGYRAAARAYDAPHMRFNLADSEVSALTLAGRLADAQDVAERFHQQAADLSGAAHALGAAIAGRAALAAGRIGVACALFDRVAVALAGHANSWGFRYNVARATALAMSGSADAAAAVLNELDALGRPFRSLDYERSLGRAWVSVGQGAISEALATLASTAETAATKGQFAAEVMCLQTMTQFGDPSHADRLLELAAMVEGPRAAAAARFAVALRDGDAPGLAAVSEEFETMGDLVAATDAAAHAAIVYRSRDRRGAGLTCSTRADELAQQCGFVTPALDRASERIPLTDREREVAMLVATRLTNGAIAERLSLSTRTVEGHVYRAMAKTGTTTREELGALFRRHRP